MLTNGARWYGETPEGRAEYAKQLKSDFKSVANNPSKQSRRVSSSDGIGMGKSYGSYSDDFYKRSSDTLARQNQFLVTTLLCM